MGEYQSLVKRLQEEESKGSSGELFKYEKYNEIQTKIYRDDIDRSFGLLCVEMKQLYVSITRPKKRLIIYDANMKGKRGIYDYWINQEVAEV